jgi:hypothetical protein
MNKIIIQTLLIIIIITTQFSFGFSIDDDILALENKYLNGESEWYNKEDAKVLDIKIINNRNYRLFRIFNMLSSKKRVRVFINEHFSLSNNEISIFLINILNNPPLVRCQRNRINGGKSVLEKFWILYPQKTKEWVNSNMKNFDEYGISEIITSLRHINSKYAINFAYNYLNDKTIVRKKSKIIADSRKKRRAKLIATGRIKISKKNVSNYKEKLEHKSSNHFTKNDLRLCDYAYNALEMKFSKKKMKIKGINNNITIFRSTPLEIRDEQIQILLNKKNSTMNLLIGENLPWRF